MNPLSISKSTIGLSVAGGGGAISYLEPVVKWVLDGCPGPRPGRVDDLVTASIVLLALCAWHAIVTREPKLAEDIGVQPEGTQQ